MTGKFWLEPQPPDRLLAIPDPCPLCPVNAHV